ncbi:MAG TPA: hypothetical protein DCE43_21180 [Planctomycetaceae bacterium]|nr:hypothetical protein [Planctomycetaceae bacterium]|tara:strand:- start:1887 stop:2642 length:756 start_codon:yes stop_codon:yes gene_type:complete
MSFLVLVPTKRVPDTDGVIRVAPDGLDVDTSHLSYLINPFDAIAVEEALRLRERRDDVEVVAVGIGGEAYEDELRTALAMGADRAIRVDAPEPLDPWNVANILAELSRRLEPRLVLMGKQAVDDDSAQAGQFLAARLGWPQATFASRIDESDDGATVARETDHGIETIAVTWPAVITVDLRLNEPRYASLPGIMAARSKAIQEIPLAELGIEIQRRVELVELQQVSSERAGRRLETVDELLDHLKENTDLF